MIPPIMDLDDLKQLAIEGESELVEFKKSTADLARANLRQPAPR